MSKQAKPSSKAFLVAADIFAVYGFPFLLASLNFLLLLSYGFLCTMIKLDRVTQVAGILIITLWIAEAAIKMGQNTPHLRTTMKDLKIYMWQFLRILLVSCLTALAAHLALMFLDLLLLPYSRIFDPSIKHTGIGALCGLLEAFLFYRLAHHTFLQAPLPQKSPELLRGQDLSRSEEIEERAWKNDG